MKAQYSNWQKLEAFLLVASHYNPQNKLKAIRNPCQQSTPITTIHPDAAQPLKILECACGTLQDFQRATNTISSSRCSVFFSMR
jgi:hypothetical protein